MYSESDAQSSTPGGPFEGSTTDDTQGIQDTHRQKSQDKKILFLIAACNDNFIRFFNL